MSETPHSTSRTLLALAALAGGLPAAAAAQGIRGHALQAGDRQPIASAEVVALDSLGEGRAVTLTDSAGFFHLQVPGEGRYRVQVSHVAYDTTVSRPVEVAFDELVDVEVLLGQRAIDLDPLVVVARRRPSAVHLKRYYDRLERHEKTGRGVIITRDQLDSLPVMTVGHAVSMHVRSRFRTTTGERCSPAVYWNGMRIDDSWDPYRSVGAEIPLSSIEGIEAYHASRVELPAEYADERCGVILLWSRVIRPGDSDGIGFWKAAAFVGAALFFGLIVAH